MHQEDIAKNREIIINEAKNISLFTKEKIIFVNQTEEKTLETLENCKREMKILK